MRRVVQFLQRPLALERFQRGGHCQFATPGDLEIECAQSQKGSPNRRVPFWWIVSDLQPLLDDPKYQSTNANFNRGTVASTVSMAIFFATKDKASNDPARKAQPPLQTKYLSLIRFEVGFSSEIAILVVVENTLTIIASCFASIWPLLTNFMPWLQLSASRSQPKTPGQYLHLQESPKPNKSTDSTAPCNEGQVSPEGKSWYSEASRGSLVLDLESQKPPHA